MKLVVALSFIFVAMLSASLATDIKYDKVVFKSSNGQYFATEDNGSSWKQLRIVDNNFDNQIYINKDKKFKSDNKGKEWIEIVQEVENQENNSIQVFPNPVKADRINLKFEMNSNSRYEIMIYTVDGSKVFYSEYNTNENVTEVALNIGSMIPGTYIVTISESGNMKYGKFIVE